MSEEEREQIKCSKCGRTGVPIAKFKIGTSGQEWICEECAKS